MTGEHTGPYAALTKSDSTSFYVIFASSFVVFLVIALVSQLLMFKWRLWFPGAEGDLSLIEGVKAAVYSFMSYID